MPSPVGHALAGMAAGWLVVGPARGRGATGAARDVWFQALAFGFVGALPDIDLLIGTHSGPTHGLGSALILGLAVLAISASQDPSRLPPPLRPGRSVAGARPNLVAWRLALAMALAYATHTLLDWMGNDTTPPIGIMALWPFSREYYESDLHVFMAISRRHWLPNFWSHNLTAVGREIAILGPIALAVWLATRRRST